MTAKEKLVEELKDKIAYKDEPINGATDIYLVADFILADRKRIVEPLVKCESNLLSNQYYGKSDDGLSLCNACRKNAIDDAIRNGLGKGEA